MAGEVPDLETNHCVVCKNVVPRELLKPLGLNWGLICVVCVQEPERMALAIKYHEEQLEAARLTNPNGLIIVDHFGARPALNADVQPIIDLAYGFHDPAQVLFTLSEALWSLQNPNHHEEDHDELDY